MSDAPKPPGKPAAPGTKVQLQVDDTAAQGLYSNFVLLNHTENEFVLDFAFIQPNTPRAKVISRIVSSPRHTKRLLRALAKNIDRYEEQFGPIDIDSRRATPPQGEGGDSSLH